MFLSSCDRNSDSNPATPATATLQVTALFPTNGANWNDYVSSLTADIACDAAADTACVHGGEHRVVPVPGKTSCNGLSATDSLGSFIWVCDSSTGSARFVSTGLVQGKALSDLLDFAQAAFKPNAVTISDNGVTLGVSPSDIWWNNPVVIQNTGGSLSSASTLYLVTLDTNGVLSLDASKIAVVVQPGVTLQGPGTGSAVIGADATSSARDFLWIEGNIDAAQDIRGVSLAFVRYSQLRNLAISNALNQGIYLAGASHNIFAEVTMNNTRDAGIVLDSASSDNTLVGVTANNSPTGSGVVLRNLAANNTLSDVSASGNFIGVFLGAASNNTLTHVNAINNDNGVSLEQASDNNFLSQVTVGNSVNYGIYLLNVSGNTLAEVTVSNTRDYGIYVTHASGNTFSGVAASKNTHGVFLDTAANNNTLIDVNANNNLNAVVLKSASNNKLMAVTANHNANGIRLTSATHNIVVGVTASNNAGSGVFLESPATNNTLTTNNTLAGVTASNNGSGFSLDSTSTNNHLLDLAVSNNLLGISFANGINTIAGRLAVGNNRGIDCSEIPGLALDCGVLSGSATFTLVTNISVENSFVGKLSFDDLANASDTLGGSTSFPADPASFDWTHFDSRFRSWGNDVSIFPLPPYQLGPWAKTSGGRIWDWSLNASDNVLRGIYGVPTGDDSITQIWAGTPNSADDSGCNTLVNAATWNGSACVSTFLRHAMEISGDGIGNENGLCESGETCLFMPNSGSYQGHGGEVDSAAFVDGTLTGIHLRQYELNGETIGD